MSFVGSVVSIDCGEAVGTYQGVVKSVNEKDNSICLTKPFRNGKLCTVPEVTIKYVPST